MKVAYNACFGGFGLSAKASTEYAKRKGLDLTFYKQTKYSHNTGKDVFEKVANAAEGGLFLNASTKDLGDIINEIPSPQNSHQTHQTDRTMRKTFLTVC
ncbi:MAG: hypothetical protein V7765_21305, partial [Oleispira sp.]